LKRKGFLEPPRTGKGQFGVAQNYETAGKIKKQIVDLDIPTVNGLLERCLEERLSSRRP
jgi:hypothetical protein